MLQFFQHWFKLVFPLRTFGRTSTSSATTTSTSLVLEPKLSSSRRTRLPSPQRCLLEVPPLRAPAAVSGLPVCVAAPLLGELRAPGASSNCGVRIARLGGARGVHRAATSLAQAAAALAVSRHALPTGGAPRALRRWNATVLMPGYLSAGRLRRRRRHGSRIGLRGVWRSSGIEPPRIGQPLRRLVTVMVIERARMSWVLARSLHRRPAGA